MLDESLRAACKWISSLKKTQKYYKKKRSVYLPVKISLKLRLYVQCNGLPLSFQTHANKKGILCTDDPVGEDLALMELYEEMLRVCLVSKHVP